MTERMVKTDGAEICVETFGDPANPPVLLVMGIMASMLWWPDRFCEELARADLFVLRYDNRDTGRSTNWPQGKPGYDFNDMTDDAVAVLRAYGIDRAHVVGMSMGGMIAQRIALKYPEQVATLTIISSSPLGVDGLPSSTAAYQAHSAEGEKVDWSDIQAIAAYILKDAAMLAGTKHPHDSQAAAALIARDIERARNFPSVTNHFMLFERDGEKLLAEDIKAPLLVIHGASDPLFPIGHGEAMASLVTGSRIHRIDGGGHEIHDRDIDEVVSALVGHVMMKR